MLPHSYELPAALFLVLGGALSCFAGYRLFKVTLGIYGFIFGAMFVSSTMGASNATGMIAAAILGGVVGALVFVFAYFIGIALVGAGLGALVAHVGWGYVRPGDPPAVAIVVLAVLGAIGAMLLQRYVIIVVTAFGGAWTLIIGALAIADRGAERASRVGDVWILYPTTVAPAHSWVPIAWILLGLVGTGVQLGVTGRKK
jgi:Domain of unknown function (DUF4203)